MHEQLILPKKENRDSSSSKPDSNFRETHQPEIKGNLRYNDLINSPSKIDSKFQSDTKEEFVYNVKVVLDHYINNERFILISKNNKIYLTHPIWSLSGMGKNLLDAELDLINDAKIIAEEYIHEVDKNLSQEAQKLKEFLIQIV